MDGVDAALVSIEHGDKQALPILEAATTVPFSQSLVEQLEQAKAQAEVEPQELLTNTLGAHLDDQLARAFAEAALTIINMAGRNLSEITAIGSHGQTLSHRPDDNPPMSLQLGNPQTIAKLTGITTVGSFRQADLEVGGQGAPLAPLLHQPLFGDPTERRAVLNLGGIANLTLLVPGEPIMGWDTGPANGLLDLWYRRHHADNEPPAFDVGGQWAKGGNVDFQWLRSALNDSYFQMPAPKSTSIEYFGNHWLDTHLKGYESLSPRDVQASLSQLTATSVAQALDQLPTKLQGVERVIVCGGGVHNDTLMADLAHALPNTTITPADELGVSTDHLEAMLFAWLAHQRMTETLMDTRLITGARSPVLLGETHSP